MIYQDSILDNIDYKKQIDGYLDSFNSERKIRIGEFKEEIERWITQITYKQLKEKFLKDENDKFLNNIKILKNNNIINFSFRRIFTLIQINNLHYVISRLEKENTKFFLESVPVDEIKNLSNKSVDDIVKFVLEISKNSLNKTTEINLVQTAELINTNKQISTSDENQTNESEELGDDIVIIDENYNIPSQEIKTTNNWLGYFNHFASNSKTN